MVVAFENPSDDQSIGRSVYLRTALLLIGWAIAAFFALCPRHIPIKRRDGGHPIGGLGDREIRLAKN